MQQLAILYIDTASVSHVFSLKYNKLYVLCPHFLLTTISPLILKWLERTDSNVVSGNDNFEYQFEEPYNRPYDTSNTALFREISDGSQDVRIKRKPFQQSNPSQQKVSLDLMKSRSYRLF